MPIRPVRDMRVIEIRSVVEVTYFCKLIALHHCICFEFLHIIIWKISAFSFLKNHSI